MTAKGDSTRDRLIAEGMRLFAEKGFRGTTVGDIESAAGLTPRSGALYKHFESKRAVLEAGLQNAIDRGESRRADLVDLIPLGDLRSDLTLLVRVVLLGMDAFRTVTQILEKDGEDFPELRDKVREQIAQPNYQQTATYIRSRVEEFGRPDWDVDALVAALGGAVINYKRMQWTFGKPPLEIDEERFIATFVEIAALLVAPHNAEPTPVT